MSRRHRRLGGLLRGLGSGARTAAADGLARGAAVWRRLDLGRAARTLVTTSPVRSVLGISVTGTGGLPTVASVPSGLVVLVVVLSLPARQAPGGGGSGVGLRTAGGAFAAVDVGRVHQGAAAGLGGHPAARAHAGARRRRGVLQKVTYQGSVPHLFDTALYRPVVRWALRAAAFVRRLQSGSLAAYMFYLLLLVLVMLAWAQVGRMSTVDRSSPESCRWWGASPSRRCCPAGATLKGRLQGRRGPSLLQPYRELARLWSRSMVDARRDHVIYRLAPPVVVACLAVYAAAAAGRRDLAGLAAGPRRAAAGRSARLGPFRLAVASWDTGSGFSLMGASRDLTFAVFVEGLLLLVVTVAALPLGSTDLLSLSAAGVGPRRLEFALSLAGGGGLPAGDHRRDRAPDRSTIPTPTWNSP